MKGKIFTRKDIISNMVNSIRISLELMDEKALKGEFESSAVHYQYALGVLTFVNCQLNCFSVDWDIVLTEYIVKRKFAILEKCGRL